MMNIDITQSLYKLYIIRLALCIEIKMKFHFYGNNIYKKCFEL